MSKDYGERRCPTCKEIFEATYPGQICCSEKCRLERKRKLTTERGVRARLRKKEELLALKGRVAELEAELEEIHVALESAQLDSSSAHVRITELERELADAKGELTLIQKEEEGRQESLVHVLAERDKLKAELEQEIAKYKDKLGKTRGAKDEAAHERNKFQKELARAQKRIRELEGSVQKPSPADAVKKGSVAPQIDTSNFPYCERMRLRAKELPCGEREECDGCPKATELLGTGEELCLHCKKPSTPRAPDVRPKRQRQR